MRSAMYYFFLLVVLFSCTVLCQDCMSFNFENGTQDFNNEAQICDSLEMWNFGNYSDLSIELFHPQSSVFAFPPSRLSCMSSPVFQMGAGGTLEFNLYLKPKVQQDYILVIVYNIENNMTTSVLIKNLILTEGWQSINITVVGSESFLGYVTFMGIATEPSSALLFDSFRYIPPAMKKEKCQIYEDVYVIDPEEDKDREEDKKPRYSIFFMIKMGIIKIFN